MKINRQEAICKAFGKRVALAGIIATSVISTTVKAEIDINELGYELPEYKTQVSKTPPAKAATGLGVGAIVGAAVGGPVGAFVGGVGGLVLAETDENHKQLVVANEKLTKINTDLELAQLELKDAKMLLRQQEERESIKLASLQNDLMRQEQNQLQHTEAMQAVSTGFVMAIQFRSGSFEIEEHYQNQLKKLASSLNILSEIEVELSGFTDPRGESVANLELSSNRVQQVKKLLVDAGVQKERISESSIGEGELMCKLEDTKGYQFERRVEIKFRFITDSHGARVAQN